MVTKNECCCCLSEVCCKDICNEYIHNGYREIYREMLFDIFNLNISYQESNSRLICEDCIIKLRDASAFKKQVLQIEDTANRRIMINRAKDDVGMVLNEKDDFIDHITGEFDYEFKDSGDETQFDDDDFNWHTQGQHDDDDENVFVIKLESDDDTPLHLFQKPKLCKKKSNISNIKKEKLIALKSKTGPPKKTATRRESLKNLPQFDRKENSLKLINNSNICLFESLKTKFRCFYCKNSYFTITELREHTSTHSNESYLKMCINRLQGMSYKCVDISHLACKICAEELKDLIDLKSHLVDKHELKFSGEENMLIPYRLDKGFECAMCEQNFNSFFKLSVHMNMHYMNHVCEICGASYINRLSLRMHVNSRHKEKKCSLCPATFTNAYLRVKHMRKVHNTSESKRYCLLCNKTFRYTYMLDEHKIQEHGMKRAVSICPECGKSFLSAVNLRTHIRCVHIKERNHPCSHCGMCFFTSCDRRRHERTHQDLRSFACSYCDGRFKSKDSLRRHLKRQHGHLYITDPQHI